MRLSQSLFKELNSSVDLEKRVKLARNAFIVTNLNISYKEEIILSWFTNQLKNMLGMEEENIIMNGLHLVVSSKHMGLLTSTDVHTEAKSEILKNLKDISKSISSPSDVLCSCVLKIISNAAFANHLKRHPKEIMDLVPSLLQHVSKQEDFVMILDFLIEIYNRNVLYEKVANAFLRKTFTSVFTHAHNYKNNEVNAKLVILLQTFFFSKVHMKQHCETLECFYSTKEVSENVLLKKLLNKMQKIFTSDDESKILIFQTLFEAFCLSLKKSTSLSVVHLFIVLCHLVGFGKNITIKVNGTSTSIINQENFHKFVQDECSLHKLNTYEMVSALMSVLSRQMVHLSSHEDGAVYTSWFQRLPQAALASNQLISSQLDILTSCIAHDPAGIDTTIGVVLKAVLMHDLSDDAVVLSYTNFLNMALLTFAKLQRVQKLIDKYMDGIHASATKVPIEVLLPADFVSQYVVVVSLLPSQQSVAFMESLMGQVEGLLPTLDVSRADEVNVVAVQASCELLAAFLRGARMAGHTVPRNMAVTFSNNMNRLHGILGRFGTALLARPHDRSLVQPYLKLSMYWGELSILMSHYVAEDTSDSSHSSSCGDWLDFLDREQWGVLCNRVANFGPGQCSRLFLQLALQSLRVSKLRNAVAETNVFEDASRYMFQQLSSDVYKHKMAVELSPADMRLVLDSLGRGQARDLVHKFISQLWQSDDATFEKWTSSSELHEIVLFTTEAFTVALQHIATVVKTEGDGFDFAERLRVVFTDGGDVEQLSSALETAFLNKKRLKNCSVGDVTLAVRLIRNLPLSYSDHALQAKAVVCLTALAVLLNARSHSSTDAVLSLTDSLLNTGLINICELINCGHFLTWTFSNPQRQGSQNRVKLLVKACASSVNGLDQLGSLVADLKLRKTLAKKILEDEEKFTTEKEIIEQEVQIHNALRLCWIRGKTETAQSANDAVGILRQHLAKSMRRSVEAGRSTPGAYSVILARNAGNAGTLQRLIGAGLPAYVTHTLKQITEESEERRERLGFLSTVLLVWPRLPADVRTHFPADLVFRIWKSVSNCPETDYSLFFKVTTPLEFQAILVDLTQNCLTSLEKDVDAFQSSLNIYKNLLTTKHTEDFSEKRSLCLRQVEVVLSRCGEVTVGLTGQADSPVRFSLWRDILQLLHVVASSQQALVGSDLVGICLWLPTLVPWSRLDLAQFCALWTSCLDMAGAVVTTLSSFIPQKVHSVFSLFAVLLPNMARRADSSQQLPDSDISQLASCAFVLERFTSLCTKLADDFARVSVEFIAEIVHVFVTLATYPAVKMHLTNCAYFFLDLADEHTVKHLMRALPQAEGHVFNSLHSQYTKFHKFKGKI